MQTQYGYHCGWFVVLGQPTRELLDRLCKIAAASKYGGAYILIPDRNIIISVKIQRGGIRAGAYVQSEKQAAAVAAFLARYCPKSRSAWSARGSTAVEVRCSGLWRIFDEYGLIPLHTLSRGTIESLCKSGKIRRSSKNSAFFS